MRGNTLGKTGVGAQSYLFDAANRMNEVTGKQVYRYDGTGRRVQTTDADGKTTYTATTDHAKCGIVWGPGDEQAHGEGGDPPRPPLKVGSTVTEWVDANGIHHAVISRVE